MTHLGSMWELIDRRVAATPDALLVRDEHDRTLSFAEYATEAERAAAGLANYGVKEGAVVSWQLPTWIESLVLVGALSRLGAVQNPILPIYREREVGFICEQADAELIIVPSTWGGFDFEAMATSIATARPGMKVLVADHALPQGDPTMLAARPTWDDTDADADADTDGQPVRWLFYTSGTTSVPKGARHVDASIAAVGVGMAERLELAPTDRSALVFPFTHIGGITWLFSALHSGCSLIAMEAFHPQRTTEVLADAGVTVAGSGTPFHQAYLAAQRASAAPIFPAVRCFPGGGAAKPPALVAEMREAFGAPIVSGWGLTEAPILTMASVHDTDDELATSEGKAMPGVELRIVGPDGGALGPGEAGEVRAKAPQLMRGYLDAALDADAFDDDGWFRTGDLGRLDAAGNLAIVGRLKDIIVRKGENVSAKEVEDLLFGHPGIADVAVIGLPDVERGEMVVAVAVPVPGAELDLAGIVDHLRAAGLMVQKLPERLELVDGLPRNPAGKVSKQELVARWSTSA